MRWGRRECHCRHRPQCSNIFPETAEPIRAKLYLDKPLREETKIGINGPGHMTKIITMPKYGKTP